MKNLLQTVLISFFCWFVCSEAEAQTAPATPATVVTPGYAPTTTPCVLNQGQLGCNGSFGVNSNGIPNTTYNNTCGTNPNPPGGSAYQCCTNSGPNSSRVCNGQCVTCPSSAPTLVVGPCVCCPSGWNYDSNTHQCFQIPDESKKTQG